MFRKDRREALLKNEEENLNKFKDVEFEKGDFLAMIVAALITFVPVILLVLGGLWFVLWLLFLR